MNPSLQLEHASKQDILSEPGLSWEDGLSSVPIPPEDDELSTVSAAIGSPVLASRPSTQLFAENASGRLITMMGTQAHES
jgi:hypothetical protein